MPFENEGSAFTIGFGPWSYSRTTVTFGDTEYTYTTGGTNLLTSPKLSNWTFGGWVSKVGCNNCEPEDLNEFFVSGDLVLGLGAGIATTPDGKVQVGSAHLGLGYSMGITYTPPELTTSRITDPVAAALYYRNTQSITLEDIQNSLGPEFISVLMQFGSHGYGIDYGTTGSIAKDRLLARDFNKKLPGSSPTKFKVIETPETNQSHIAEVPKNPIERAVGAIGEAIETVVASIAKGIGAVIGGIAKGIASIVGANNKNADDGQTNAKPIIIWILIDKTTQLFCALKPSCPRQDWMTK